MNDTVTVDKVNVILDRMDALTSLVAAYGAGNEDSKEKSATVLFVAMDILQEQTGKIKNFISK